MGQVLHGSATTTEAVRRAIQGSQESLRALASRYGINPKTVAKWRTLPSKSDRLAFRRQASDSQGNDRFSFRLTLRDFGSSKGPFCSCVQPC